MRIIIAVLVVVLQAGCALLTMQFPRTDDPSEPPRCSEAKGGVVLDVAFASTAGIAGLVAKGADEGTLASLAAATGLVYLVSALGGYAATSECTEAHTRHLRWREDAGITKLGLQGSGRGSKPQGDAGQACYPNKTCNEGLSCDSTLMLCVEASQTIEAALATDADTVLDAYPEFEQPERPEPREAEPERPGRAEPERPGRAEPERPGRPVIPDFWREVPR